MERNLIVSTTRTDVNMRKLMAYAGFRDERKGQLEGGWGVVGPGPSDWTRWREIREINVLRCLRMMLKDETQSHKDGGERLQ
jgi:hypothetical protein